MKNNEFTIGATAAAHAAAQRADLARTRIANVAEDIARLARKSSGRMQSEDYVRIMRNLRGIIDIMDTL
jgi:hypothetical protein